MRGHPLRFAVIALAGLLIVGAAITLSPSLDGGRSEMPKAEAPPEPGQPVSVKEMEAIQKHVSKLWSVPDNAKEIVEVRVQLQPDGAVKGMQVVNQPPSADALWLQVAESARRAVQSASPLPIPPDKYDQFHDFILVFNPKQMLGGR